MDFTAGDTSGDVIELTGYGVTTFAQLQAFMTQNGSDVVIAFDNNNEIMVHGVTLGQLNQNDFVLNDASIALLGQPQASRRPRMD